MTSAREHQHEHVVEPHVLERQPGEVRVLWRQPEVEICATTAP
jgi:hypothetical protein